MIKLIHRFPSIHYINSQECSKSGLSVLKGPSTAQGVIIVEYKKSTGISHCKKQSSRDDNVKSCARCLEYFQMENRFKHFSFVIFGGCLFVSFFKIIWVNKDYVSMKKLKCFSFIDLNCNLMTGLFILHVIQNHQ